MKDGSFDYRPGKQWVFLASVILVALAGLPAFLFKPEILLTVGGWFGLLVTLAFIGFFWGLFSWRVRLRVDVAERRLVILKGPLRRRTECPLDDVVGVEVARSQTTMTRGNVTFRIVLTRKSGEVLPLTGSTFAGEDYQNRCAQDLRVFLGLARVP
jgi:hypothetical protein